MKKESPKPESHPELMKRLNAKIDKWERMENGDIKALIELSVERGLANEEDFPDYFLPTYARARLPPLKGLQHF